MEEYSNKDGTYTSPKNGKTYKSLKAFLSHWHYAGTTDPNAFKNRLYNVQCKFCGDNKGVSNIKKHEDSCYLNSKNLRLCEVCKNPIKNYKESKGTCSYTCSNTFFKHLRNKPEKHTRYTTLCFANHKKECIVCGENKIVAVHHFNEDHNDNRIENLIPLCPTHHQYMHSRYKCEIINIVEDYIKNFNLRVA